MLLDSFIYRLSVIHAHPRGPWQAILGAVQSHHARWLKQQQNKEQGQEDVTRRRRRQDNHDNLLPPPLSHRHLPLIDVKEEASATSPTTLRGVYRVLDLASGPRGEPGTTIAHALPSVSVHCTDSCALAVEAIPTFTTNPLISTTVTTVAVSTCTNVAEMEQQDLPPTDASSSDTMDPPLPPPTSMTLVRPPPPPPRNLTKSIQDLTCLASYESNSIDVIVSCYGYGLSSNMAQALEEAHRVLVPGGILVIASWERCALLSLGRDVLTYVRSGSATDRDEEEALFLPPIAPVGKIEWSGVGELEAMLVAAGFVDDDDNDDSQPQQDGDVHHDRPSHTVAAVVTTRGMVYPYDLGMTIADQFTMGTILIREELEELGALQRGEGHGGLHAGGWNSLAEEAFWMSVQKYTEIDEADGAMLLKDNVFKLTVSTKSSKW